MAQAHSFPDRVQDGTLADGVPRAADGESTDTVAPLIYVHPEAATLFAACPMTRSVPLFGDVCQTFGPRGTVALGGCYFFNKGIGNYLVNYCRYAMFRDRFGINGTRYQRLSTLRTMGWSVKAFSASISDTFALFGYTKRWYCAGSSVAGGAFALAFALMPAKQSSANTAAGFMFLTNFCVANIDILSEGHYSRVLRKRPAAGPAFVSWIWALMFASAVLSVAIQGPLSDKKIPQVGLFLSAAFQVVVVFVYIINWYGERLNRIERQEDVLVEAERERQRRREAAGSDSEKSVADIDPDAMVKDLQPEKDGLRLEREDVPGRSEPIAVDEELRVAQIAVADVDDDEVDHSTYIKSLCGGAVEVNKELFFRNWRLYVYSAIMVAAVIAQCLVTVFGQPRQLAYCCAVISVVCCATGFWACSLVVPKAILFEFMDMLLYVQISGVMDSFYMATPACYPDGPHFSYVFYNTIATVIGNAGGICGGIAFPYIFSQRSYWFTFIITTVIKVLASLFDIVMVKRWNLAIGIPDHAMYIMGDAIVYQVCYEFSWMPMVLLLWRVCPRGSESMIYALAAGFSNTGQSVSSSLGSIFVELVWPVVTKGTHGECDFHNVPMLLLVAHILLPLGVIPLSILLLPRARICDDIDEDGKPVRTDRGTRAPATNSAAAPAPSRASHAPLDEHAGFEEHTRKGEREEWR